MQSILKSQVFFSLPSIYFNVDNSPFSPLLLLFLLITMLITTLLINIFFLRGFPVDNYTTYPHLIHNFTTLIHILIHTIILDLTLFFLTYPHPYYYYLSPCVFIKLFDILPLFFYIVFIFSFTFLVFFFILF